MTLYLRLDINFPFDLKTYRQQTTTAEKVVGKRLSDAGAGFGKRDVGFVFTTEERKDAEAARDRVKKKMPDAEVELNEYDTDVEED